MRGVLPHLFLGLDYLQYNTSCLDHKDYFQIFLNYNQILHRGYNIL